MEGVVAIGYTARDIFLFSSGGGLNALKGGIVSGTLSEFNVFLVSGKNVRKS